LTGIALLALAVAANAQGLQPDKDAVAAVFDKYVPYLNSVNTDAISTEIYAVPVLMPIPGGRHVILSTPQEFSKAWKSYLEGAAKNGLQNIALDSVNVALVGPDAAIAEVTYLNRVSTSPTPVQNVWLYVLQKTSNGWRIVTLFQKS
jgi:hypothetical protein